MIARFFCSKRTYPAAAWPFVCLQRKQSEFEKGNPIVNLFQVVDHPDVPGHYAFKCMLKGHVETIVKATKGNGALNVGNLGVHVTNNHNQPQSREFWEKVLPTESRSGDETTVIERAIREV